MHAPLRLITMSLVAVLLAGCGGGGPLAGIDRLGISSGPVTGFGSVVVNGVRYEVPAGFEVSISGTPGGQADLQVGQQVTVRWQTNPNGTSRIAAGIEFNPDVGGPVTAGSQDAAAGTVVVLGQTVRVSAATSFGSDLDGFAGLTNGRAVTVSGLRDSTGAIRATRIDPRSTGALEVRGVATDVTAAILRIGNLQVDYGAASLPAGPPANGDLVQVRGTTVNLLGRLVATVVAVQDDFGTLATGRDDAELEGLITAFTTPGAVFRVGGARVRVTAQTQFESGRSATDLANDVGVEVEGSVDANGVLVAREIDFKSFDADGDGDDDELEGRVAGDVTARADAAVGTVLVAGVTVTVSAATRLEDKRDRQRPFRLADLDIGDFVSVRGRPGSGATLAAAILEREAASSTGRLRGPANAIALPGLTVLGVPVVTVAGSTQFRAPDGTALTQAAFFAAIAPGTEVAVTFQQGASPVTALVAEIEDGDDGGDDD